jgi:hypothetical protein
MHNSHFLKKYELQTTTYHFSNNSLFPKIYILILSPDVYVGIEVNQVFHRNVYYNFMAYLKTVSISDYTASNHVIIMNNELERIRKGGVVA